MSDSAIFEVTVNLNVVEQGHATHSVQVTMLVRVPVAYDPDEYDRDLMNYYETAKERALELLRPLGNNRTHIDPMTAVLRYVDED